VLVVSVVAAIEHAIAERIINVGCPASTFVVDTSGSEANRVVGLDCPAIWPLANTSSNDDLARVGGDLPKEPQI
jgi:hypothetical protein